MLRRSAMREACYLINSHNDADASARIAMDSGFGAVLAANGEPSVGASVCCNG